MDVQKLWSFGPVKKESWSQKTGSVAKEEEPTKTFEMITNQIYIISNYTINNERKERG